MDFETDFHHKGRMISDSRIGYRASHPDNFVVFNANVFDRDGRRVWYGDLDVTEDADRLTKLSASYGGELHVLPESAVRPGVDADLSEAVAVVRPGGVECVGEGAGFRR